MTTFYDLGLAQCCGIHPAPRGAARGVVRKGKESGQLGERTYPSVWGHLLGVERDHYLSYFE
jgi:hypothetical protein